MYDFETHLARAAESKRAASAEPPAFRAASALLERAERQIDLLGRVRPLDGCEQVARWLAARGRGENAKWTPSYAPPPDLGELRRALEWLSRHLEEAPPSATSPALAGASAAERNTAIGRLYAGRARELASDAQLAENIGTPAFAALARRRHDERPGEDWEAARRLSRSWAQQRAADDDDPSSTSDDAASPTSLLSVLRGEVGRLRLPLRIELCPSLATRAATGDGVIYVRTGLPLGRREAERIALHELHGHALPRLRARAQLVGLFRAGTEHALDDEEGRAVLLEERAGLLDTARRRELGLRHWAALAVARGADAHECVSMLEDLGCTADDAIGHYRRSSRGGGLCRELEYLPAWHRVSASLAADPDLDRWLARGRLGLDAAALLRKQGIELIEA